MYNQNMYWIVEYIQENNLERREWNLVIDEAQKKYLKALAK